MSSAVDLLKRANAQYSLDRLVSGKGGQQSGSSSGEESKFDDDDEEDDSTIESIAAMTLKQEPAHVVGSVHKSSPAVTDNNMALPTTNSLNTADRLSDVILRLVNVCHHDWPATERTVL
jgi:hypothetical protein